MTPQNGVYFENLEHLEELRTEARAYVAYHRSQVNTHAQMSAFWANRLNQIEAILSPLVEAEEIARKASEALD